MSDANWKKLADEWEATRIIARLFFHLDAGEYPAVAALFADDGVWVRLGENLVGPAAVLAAMKARPATLATRHLVTNLIVEAGAGGVEAHYNITVFDDAEASMRPARLTSPAAIFASHDRLIETPGGWHFASREPVAMFKRP